MAYIGRGIDKISNIEVLDAITFTDSAGPYNITQSSTAFTPTASNALVISIDGVVQSPGSYTLSAATITFDSSMSSASTMNFIYQIGTGLITEPSDDSVTAAKIATDAVTTVKILDSNVTYAKIQDTTTANRVIGAATAGVVSEVQVVDDMTNFVSTASAPGVTIRGDGTTDGYLQLNCDQNTHGVKIKSPAHADAQTYTLTLPGAAPAVNKFIETDGSGNLSFSSVDVSTDITGTVPAANLGTGTASSSTILYGDQTYKAEPVAKVKQTVSTMVVSNTSGSTTIPVDDTIPQNTEGNEFMTLAITPTSATTKLQIDVLVYTTNGTADIIMMTALFQDSTANALASSAISANNVGNNGYIPMNLTYVMTSGTTSATTFKVRCGANSGTTYFNSRSGGREFGGVLTSSIVITEYET